MSLSSEQWHAQFPACVDCGRADRPHVAKGRCEPCYRKARAAVKRQMGQGAIPTILPPKRNWHLAYPACLGCGKTNRPHHADGLCPECYRASRNLGQKGHEELPVALSSREPTSITAHQQRQIADQASAAPSPYRGEGGADMKTVTLDADPSATRPVPGGASTGATGAASRGHAPVLYARHMRIVTAFQITCPNCGESIANDRVGGFLFVADALPPDGEVRCGTCGARWSIADEGLVAQAAPSLRHG